MWLKIIKFKLTYINIDFTEPSTYLSLTEQSIFAPLSQTETLELQGW